MHQKADHIPAFFAVADWIVIGLYLLGMLGIGFYYFLQNKSEKDFYLGGGTMGPLALGLSLFVTVTSSLTYLGIPGDTIKYGPIMLCGTLSFPLIYGVVGWFLIPRFKKMNITSAYEILEIKLGVSVRLLATFFFLSLRFLWMATIVYVSVDIVILSVFDIDSSFRLVISGVLMAITIAFTSMGGLKGVVATDVVQSFILLFGALIVIVAVSLHLDSFTSWLPQTWSEQWRALTLAIDPGDRSSIGSVILMMFVWHVASAGSDQMSIQRFLASETVATARRTYGVSLMTNAVSTLLLTFVGFALVGYFTVEPQLLSQEELAGEADILFPKFMIIGLPAGISGLLISSVIAAAISSLSSGINSTATVLSEDIFKRFSTQPPKPGGELNRAILLSFLVGVAALVLSLGIPYVKGNLIDLSIKVVNLFVAPLFVLFFMALFVPFATARGTCLAGMVSTLVAVAIAFFNFLEIEVFFIVIVALFSGIVTGILCSLIDHQVFGNQETAFNRTSRSTGNR